MSFPTREYDPVKDLDRRLLPPSSQLASQLPHRGWYAEKAALVAKVVAMCRQAGIEVSEQDFLTHQLRRQIKSKVPHYGLATVTAPQLWRMYEDLRQGATPHLFVAVLAKRGFTPHVTPTVPVTPMFDPTIQGDLFQEP